MWVQVLSIVWSVSTPARAQSAKPSRSSSVLKIDIDEESEKPVAQQLREALIAQSVRVIDLFREWDTDGDGEISKKEFIDAMPKLGYTVPVREVRHENGWLEEGGGRREERSREKMGCSALLEEVGLQASDTLDHDPAGYCLNVCPACVAIIVIRVG